MTAGYFCGHRYQINLSALEHLFGVISLVGICVLLNSLSGSPLGNHSVEIIGLHFGKERCSCSCEILVIFKDIELYNEVIVLTVSCLDYLNVALVHLIKDLVGNICAGNGAVCLFDNGHI